MFCVYKSEIVLSISRNTRKIKCNRTPNSTADCTLALDTSAALFVQFPVVMENFGAFIVVAISCLIRVSIIGSDFFLYHTAQSQLELYFSVSQVVAYLLYPLLGWLSDTYFTRYKVIRLAFIVVSVTMAVFLVCDIVYINYNVYNYLTRGIAILVIIPAILFTLISLGMFEANIIQFGMDQLLEATSSQLSSFIHWYFWSTHIGQILMHLLALGFLFYYKNCTLTYASIEDILFQITAKFLMCMAAVQSILGVIGLFILIRNKKNLNVEKAGHNPLRLIYNVLSYAWKHTCPENRSAFTYWEEDIPSRVDLGKSKYGGPFTTEEVEDTKSFFRILVLLLSLMGFHLTGHGFSTARQLFRKECPSFWLLLILAAPMFLTSITVFIGVPFYHFINKYCCRSYVPNMLLRNMGIGLACCLLKELIEIALQFTQEVHCSTQDCLQLQHSYYPFVDCYFLVSDGLNVNGTCINIKELNKNFAHCTANNSVYLILLLVPNFLQGITYLLVFMTALEFICAQAPLRLKGLLIGVWYASLAFHYLVVEIPDIFINDTNTWEVFRELKACLIALSLIFYLWVSKHYRYRVRDEVVNEQFLVEEVYERELAQAEKYNREKQAEMRAIYGEPINRPISTYGTTDHED